MHKKLRGKPGVLSKEPDNCYLTKDCKCIVVKNIYASEVECQEYTKYQPPFEKPCNSSNLGILVSCRSRVLGKVSVENLLRKCILLSLEG